MVTSYWVISTCPGKGFANDWQYDVVIQLARRLEARPVREPSRALVEIDRKEPARLVGEHRVDAHDVLALQVGAHSKVVHRPERLVGAVAALHLRQRAHTDDELVRARVRVSRLSGLLADEGSRVDIVPPAKELAEQLHLFGRVVRGGGGRRDGGGTYRGRGLKSCELGSKRFRARDGAGALDVEQPKGPHLV